MPVYELVGVECDGGCGREAVDEPPKTAFFRGLRHKGWLIGAELALCPRCRKLKKHRHLIPPAHR